MHAALPWEHPSLTRWHGGAGPCGTRVRQRAGHTSPECGRAPPLGGRCNRGDSVHNPRHKARSTDEGASPLGLARQVAPLCRARTRGDLKNHKLKLQGTILVQPSGFPHIHRLAKSPTDSLPWGMNMATLALSAVEVGLLAGLLLVFHHAGKAVSFAILQAVERHLEGSKERPIPQLERLEAWAVALRDLEAKVDRLPSVWEDWDEKQSAREQRITKRIAKARRDGIAVDEGSLVPDPTGPDDPQTVLGLPGEESPDDALASEDEELSMMIFQQRFR